MKEIIPQGEANVFHAILGIKYPSNQVLPKSHIYTKNTQTKET
jgi:hypothetical protein